ncbi:hypothetical protein DACRYDRAFT_93498 [Dacryopinax primogenitus]|uniref:Zn(2)-C6 fungal-type domain-containing protein n=1 Tax=Dacryopinax primogenitus (strain DJM 731) TaxID=1858805 RepID=M5GFC6_DACPD|nr:uncharacterized protein DACRYDRAFT_93498 [Dacryopinax primogenitus]EJU04043.1 hypothetical protein DACRYDRAFT_93498 [Dacryopinax primogenitus]
MEDHYPPLHSNLIVSPLSGGTAESGSGTTLTPVGTPAYRTAITAGSMRPRVESWTLKLDPRLLSPSPRMVTHNERGVSNSIHPLRNDQQDQRHRLVFLDGPTRRQISPGFTEFEKSSQGYPLPTRQISQRSTIVDIHNRPNRYGTYPRTLYEPYSMPVSQSRDNHHPLCNEPLVYRRPPFDGHTDYHHAQLEEPAMLRYPSLIPPVQTLPDNHTTALSSPESRRICNSCFDRRLVCDGEFPCNTCQRISRPCSYIGRPFQQFNASIQPETRGSQAEFRVLPDTMPPHRPNVPGTDLPTTSSHRIVYLHDDVPRISGIHCIHAVQDIKIIQPMRTPPASHATSETIEGQAETWPCERCKKHIDDHIHMRKKSPKLCYLCWLLERRHPTKHKDMKHYRQGGPCAQCGTTWAPVWRRGPAKESLCNACGLRVKGREKMDKSNWN